MRLLAACVLALTTVQAFPQAISETMEVRVVNVDVIVVDAAGKPIQGLTRDDFTLLENGKKVDISNFYEESMSPALASAPPSSAAPSAAEDVTPDRRPRRVVVLFDESSMTPFERDRTLASLRRFLDSVIDSGDRAMVVTFNDGMTVMQPFTDDREKLGAAVDSLKGRSSQGWIASQHFPQLQRRIQQLIRDAEVEGEQPLFTAALSEVRLYADQEQRRNRRIILAVDSLVGSLAGLDGRKAVVMITNDVAQFPGREAFEFLEAVKSQFIGGEVHSPRMEAQQFNLGEEFKRMLNRANAAGVAIHTLQGAPASAQLASAEMGAAGGFDTVRGMLDGAREKENERLQTMTRIAAETGGTALVASTNIDGALDRIVDDLENYYSLGYRPAAGKGGVRAIEVKVRVPKARVRHRTALVDRNIEQEMQDRISTALNYPDTVVDTGLRITAGDVSEDATPRVQVPVTISIPTESLTLLEDGTDLVGTIGIYTGFLRRNGGISKIDVQQQSFRFPAESRNRRPSITLKMPADIDAQTHRMAVGIVDGPSQIAQLVVAELAGQ